MAIVLANQTAQADFIPGTKVPAYSVSADTTLLASMSGSSIQVTSAAANITITLPTVAAGLSYRVLMAATAGTNTVTITGAANTLFGGWFSAGGPTKMNVAGVGATSVVFPTSAAVGDYLDFICDGTRWHVSGYINNVMATAGNTTLTLANSGALITVTATAGGYTITMPAPTAGIMRFKFVLGTNAAGATAITSTAANVRFRGQFNIAAAPLGVNSAPSCTTVNIVANNANAVGDFLVYESDGVNYYAHGVTSLDAKFTIA